MFTSGIRVDIDFVQRKVFQGSLTVILGVHKLHLRFDRKSVKTRNVHRNTLGRYGQPERFIRYEDRVHWLITRGYEMHLDTLITDGMVVDGTGSLRYKADIGIFKEKIVAIGNLGKMPAERFVDASGQVVSPGFIDMHSHSDRTLLDDPGGDSKIYQGVTTEVVGNCGFSPYPVGIMGSEVLNRSHVSPVEWDWIDLDGWSDRLEKNGLSINVVPQVGHSALRYAVGLADASSPNDDQLKEMRRLVAESVEQGAFSMSTGLTVSPSMYGNTDEIVALAEAFSQYDGAFYVTHARVWAGNHVGAIKEAMEIGHRAGVPVQYSHLAIIDPRAYGSGEEMVGIIEAARMDGLDATYDVYPYTAAGSHLSQSTPQWLQEGGDVQLVQRLRDPVQRKRAVGDMREHGHFGGLPWQLDKVVISYVQSEKNRSVIGKSVAEISEERGEDPLETYLALIDEEENQVGCVAHNRVESDVRYFLSHPLGMIGSDGNAISPTGIYSIDKPHPRFYGTYPRILGRYVREQSLMSLETAIHKMTGMPAERLRLSDRGRIEKNCIADIVVFDPNTVIDHSTFDDPHKLSEGISHVLVNGSLIIVDGEHTQSRGGRVLRRDS